MALFQTFTGGELSINLTRAFTLIVRSYYYYIYGKCFQAGDKQVT